MPDRNRYIEPRRGPRLASPSENARVRELYRAELRAAALKISGGREPNGTEYGHAIGAFAREWFALRRDDIMVPQTESSANTRLRNFVPNADEEGGVDLLDWMLVGIETVIRDRHGESRPGGFYHQQGRLPV